MSLESLLKLDYFNAKFLRPKVVTKEAEGVECTDATIACPTNSVVHKLLLAVGIAKEDIDEVPPTVTVEFMSGLGIDVPKFIDASAALEALNAYLGTSFPPRARRNSWKCSDSSPGEKISCTARATTCSEVRVGSSTGRAKMTALQM